MISFTSALFIIINGNVLNIQYICLQHLILWKPWILYLLFVCNVLWINYVFDRFKDCCNNAFTTDNEIPDSVWLEPNMDITADDNVYEKKDIDFDKVFGQEAVQFRTNMIKRICASQH